MNKFEDDFQTSVPEVKKLGKPPKAADTGGLFQFDGSDGDFRETQWLNVDFGGRSILSPHFEKANLSQSTIEGSDLTEIDFSETIIDGIKIINPVSLLQMKINENQVDSLAQAIQLADKEKQLEFEREIDEKGPRKALEDRFEIIIVEAKD